MERIRQGHADYIGNWLKVLANEDRALFIIAAQARRAVDYLHSLQPGVSIAT